MQYWNDGTQIYKMKLLNGSQIIKNITSIYINAQKRCWETPKY